MNESPEDKLKTVLIKEQQYYEGLVRQPNLDQLKSRILQNVDARLAENKKEKNSRQYPTMFAIAATLVLAVSVLLFNQFPPGKFELVSQAELDREATYVSSLSSDELLSLTAIPMSSDINAPEVALVRPIDLDNISSPATIEMLFKPGGNAKINLDSFRLKYGLLGIDITEHILKHSKISVDRVIAKKVIIPAGGHRFTVYISDSLGRESKTQFKFTVNSN